MWYHLSMTAFQKAFLAIIAVLVLSLAYYLVVFLPQKEKMRLKEAETIRQESSLGLRACIAKAEDDRLAFWNQNCSSSGLDDNCSLPTETSNNVTKYYESWKDDCYKLYSQK